MDPVAVEKGMVLLVREEARNSLPESFKLWTVTSVRGAKRSSVKLIGWSPGCTMEATATFPDGLVQDPWQVFALSQRDLAHVYATTPKKADPLPERDRRDAGRWRLIDAAVEGRQAWDVLTTHRVAAYEARETLILLDKHQVPIERYQTDFKRITFPSGGTLDFVVEADVKRRCEGAPRGLLVDGGMLLNRKTLNALRSSGAEII